MESCEHLYVYSLVEDYLKYVSQETMFEAPPSRAAEVLRKIAPSLQEEVEKKLELLWDSVEITSVDKASKIFNKVMEEEFSDGNTNWGRIVTIFLFGGILAKKLQKQGVVLTKENTREISHFIADYIINTKAKWIHENGGWVSNSYAQILFNTIISLVRKY
uniref:BCL2 related protein A1 n=1 Tax=Salvator merianae TaxID=96440 RepID=A0A8D0EB90_SALMN